MAPTKLSCILLIDDNTDTNYFHRLLLKELELSELVVECRDGEMGLEYFEEEQLHPLDVEDPQSERVLVKPELVFLDVNMPRMDGWEFLEEFERLPPRKQGQTIFVMLSSHFDPEDEERALSHECVKVYMEKPLTEKKLNFILESYFPVPEGLTLVP